MSVHALTDAHGSFVTLREGFGLDDDAPWVVPVQVFLARLDGRVVLVDTGVGPAGGGSFLPDRQGWLPEELARFGVVPADVDLVVFTHLHVDHVGWNVVEGKPFFPNARYVAHQADLDWQAGRSPEYADLLEVVEPLGDESGIAVTHIPGHTPGHVAVEVGGAIMLGDAIVDERQLRDPDQPFGAEEDKAAAAAVRRRLLPELADTAALVGLSHLPGGLGLIVRDGDAFAWQPHH